MNGKQCIYILSGLDEDFSKKIKEALNFFCDVNKLNHQVEITDSLETLENNEYLVIYLDELSLGQLINNNKTKQLLLKKELNKEQVLLITDELSYHQLPDYLHEFSNFKLFLDNSEEQESDKSKSNFIQLIFDIVRYITGELSDNENKLATVFLGPPDGVTTYESHKIIRELLHHKYRIVPQIINESAKQLLSDTKTFEKLLSEADLAIHFISHESLEEFPKKVSPSIQINTKVAAYCKANNLKLERFVFIPPEDESTSEEVGIKISQFKSDMDSLLNGEILQTPIEKLKSIILSKLGELKQEINLQEDTIDSEDIYLIFPPGIATDDITLFGYLESLKINFAISQVQLDQLALLQYHQKKLTSCKGVIIINYGNEEWLQRKISDVQKSPGWGRKIPFEFMVVCGEEPSNEFMEKYNKSPFTYKSTITEEDLQKMVN